MTTRGNVLGGGVNKATGQPRWTGTGGTGSRLAVSEWLPVSLLTAWISISAAVAKQPPPPLSRLTPWESPPWLGLAPAPPPPSRPSRDPARAAATPRSAPASCSPSAAPGCRSAPPAHFSPNWPCHCVFKQRKADVRGCGGQWGQ